MTFIETIKSKAKQEIIRGNLNMALDIFSKFIDEYHLTNNDFERHYILISGTYFSNRKWWRDGVLPHDDWNILENRLRSNFLDLIGDLNSLTEEDIVKKTKMKITTKARVWYR
ncbi:MAG: hypothetical protein U0X91_22820 [Spirosomataceae bacterium]